MSDSNSFSASQPQALPVSGALVEVAPILQAMHHKETVPCYTFDAGSQSARVSQPKIELPRGAQVYVQSGQGLSIGNQVYLKITRCDLKPGAIGLYLRREEVIYVPESAPAIAFRAMGKLNLRRIKRANQAGKPILEIAGVQVPAGTILYTSSVHRVTQADAGDGVIDADGKKDYRLVVACPQVPQASGLFVQSEALAPA